MFLWQQVEIDPANHKVRPKRPPPVKIDGVLARIDPELDEIRYGGNPGGRSVANLQGLHVQGLHVGLSDKFRVQFLEDNQATITIVNKGDSEKMRHTDRTQNISFGWLKQQFEAEHFDMVNVDTLEQVADIFTKPFAEKTKWLHALRLINHNLCSDVAQKVGKDSDSHLVAKPTIAAAGHGRPSLESIAQDLLRVKDFSYLGLCSLASDFPTKAERVRLEWCHHHLWAAVLGEEFSNTPDRDWDATVKQLYKGVPVQTALSVCLGERQQGYRALCDACAINDEGLARIQPGCNRGREKGAIIVRLRCE
eukprot:s13037_g1.t1